MYVFRSILALIAAFFLFLVITPLVIIGLAASLGYWKDSMISIFGGFIGRSVLRVAGVRMKVQKCDNTDTYRPAVYIINHSSTLDLLVMIGLGLPHIRFLAKRELQYNPLFFILGRLTGQIFINRSNSEKAVANIRKAYEHIKQKKLSILVAPEGSRKHKGTIGKFKKGAFRTALDLGYPIIPIFVEGAARLSPGGSLITQPGILSVTIHEPIDTSGWKLDRLDYQIEGIRNRYLDWSKETIMAD